MHYSSNSLKNFKLGAVDGEIGRVRDFYFDDENWTVRYLVADTGTWLPRHEVLISPLALTGVESDARLLRVNLTREKVENCPDIDTARPISRQDERGYAAYYGWPVYWGRSGLWGLHPYPMMQPATDEIAFHEAELSAEQSEREATDEHLRSVREVTGYHIMARDGSIGHVEDFLIDETTWMIRFLIVDTKNWWPGRQVVIPTKSIDRVSWSERSVFVALDREQIRNAPEFSEGKAMDAAFQQRVAEYYGVSIPTR